MDNRIGLPATASSETHYAELTLAHLQVYMSHGGHFPTLSHHRLLMTVISGKQRSLPGYGSLFIFYFDHFSSHQVLVWNIVSRECSFPPVFCSFMINMNLKVSLCVYVKRVAEARNPQNKINVTTNH